MDRARHGLFHPEAFMKRVLGVSVGMTLMAQGPHATELAAESRSRWSLMPVGILGNSGRCGPDLLRVVPTGEPSGVYAAPDHTLWLDGGSHLLHVTFDGRLIEAVPLAPECERINSSAFAVFENRLYFFGHASVPSTATVAGREVRSRVACFALPLEPGSRPLRIRSCPEIQERRGGVLAAALWQGCLLCAWPVTGPAGEEEAVVSLNPSGGEVKPILRPGTRTIYGLAVDPVAGELYVGGGWLDHAVPQIAVYDLTTGREKRRSSTIKTPANPTQFRGIVSLVGDAVWDTAWYGHLARMNRDLAEAPGIVWRWGLQIGYACQIVPAVPGASDVFFLSERDLQHAYLAAWDRKKERFRLVRRIGALAEVSCVGLSPDGWVAVGAGDRTLWWRWEDDAGDPPRAANHQAGYVNGYFHEGRFVTMLPPRREPRPVAAAFEPESGRSSGHVDRGGGLAWEPVGLVRRGEQAWAVARDGTLWQARIHSRFGIPMAPTWKAVHPSGAAAPSEGGPRPLLTRPGDLGALSDGRFVAVDGGSLVILRVTGNTMTEEGRWSRWGKSPEETFGGALRLAADGFVVVVSDTERHRVLGFDMRTGRCLARVGTTDEPGSASDQLRCPGPVAVSGPQAVVYDAGNQRLVKLVLRETASEGQ